MQISTLHEELLFKIILNGDLDAGSSVVFDKAIEDALRQSQTRFLIDCTALHYISSAGLGVFMSYLQEFEEKNVKMVVFGLTDKVLNVFQILGLEQLINIQPDEEQARYHLINP
jgi:anti-sigma B factor antagonist